jgi:CheY-like chemotaxis protein
MPSVLVVDDEAVIRRSIRRCLSARGFDVMEAANGNEGIERYRSQRPDLLITDFHMAGIDGLTMIAEIRKLDPTARAVLVTGSVEEPLDCDCSFLQKPFALAELVAVVDATLREKTA